MDFPVQEAIESMDRLAKIHGQTIVETTVGFFSERKDLSYGWIGYNLRAKKIVQTNRSDFPVEETIETKDRSAIIQGQNIVELTVAFFS